MKENTNSEKIILGISVAHHDGSMCILKGGKILAAIEVERLSKKKKERLHENNFSLLLEYVLDAAEIKWEDIDYVAHGCCPEYPHFNDVELATEWSVNGKGCNYDPKTIYTVPHQLSHASASYFTSPFTNTVFLTLDGSEGDVEYFFGNSLLGWATDNLIKTDRMIPSGASIYYQRVCEYLGLGDPIHKVGTLMGLAPYGTILDSYTDLSSQHETTNLIEENFSIAANIAATAQNVLEERILNFIKNDIFSPGLNRDQYESTNLCLGGGTFYNCPTNSRILKETKFKNIHHFPACGDSGIGIGAALYVAHNILNQPRHQYKPHEICYLGKNYELKKEIDYEYIARRISEGAVVAWMNGRSEFGPRALGNRSLLADPRNQYNRDRLNHVIKQREWYRPFAPIVLEECYKDWFDFDIPSPFMLYTAQVKQRERVPAITHVDGSARFQTVTEESNTHIYKLIQEFEKITNVPMLINTSLNGKGQPILETPEDGVEFFNNNPVDIAVIHGEIMEKK